MTRSSTLNLASLLARSAMAWPTLPAVAVADRTLHDYAGLAARSARLARGLADCSCAPGDRVVLVARNVVQYIEALFACWWAGLVAVPVNTKLHPAELDYVIEDSAARLALVDDAWESALAQRPGSTIARVVRLGGSEYAELCNRAPVPEPAPVAADDPAWLFYTSGTTGRPKGVVISHGNLRAMSACFLAAVETVSPGDAIVHAAPLSHGSGLYVVPHVARAAVSVVPESGGFDASEVVECVNAWRGALMFAAPTMVKRLVSSPAVDTLDRQKLKCIVYGGGPMYVEDCKLAFATFGARLAQIYGQGESPMTITAMDRALLADAMARGDVERIASVGCAQPDIEVRIVDDDGRALDAGCIGEVVVRGPTVMQGYWRNPEASARTLAGGWLHTGDLGQLAPDGFLTLKDRSKDLVISGGSNIYPREVEEVLLRHPDVHEVAVVGARHQEWGEEVVACVVPRRTLDRDQASRLVRDLDAACLAALARFKRPFRYIVLEDLPKNNAGKVMKTTLREGLDRLLESAIPRPDAKRERPSA